MIPSILQVGDVLLSSDIITEHFCCDLEACLGACCIEGESGAPVTLNEIAALEDAVPKVQHLLTHRALRQIEKEGVAYTDAEFDLVTNILDGKDCVFCFRNVKQVESLPSGCALCAVEGKSKPISCALYPIREKRFKDGTIGLNLHRWRICEAARKKGQNMGLPVYQFLREPLIKRFGAGWYEELEALVELLKKEGMIG